jgi:hypothetical protein
VYGARFLTTYQQHLNLSWHVLGNGILTKLSNLLTRLDLTDMETGYKAVRTDLLQSLRLASDGFDIEPELTARLARIGARICEVPISYKARSYAEGKKIMWTDGVRALWSMLRYRAGP